MFETEQSSKRAFFNRISRYGRQSILEPDYDYFNPDDKDDEPEKEPDITWDMNDNTSSPSDSQEKDENDVQEPEQEQESSEDNGTTEEPEDPKTFWGKLKNFLK
jgi:hypothetical protein